MTATLTDIREISFPVKPSPEASLSVYEAQTHVPFPIRRVFVVSAETACDRGFHAHRQCQQLLVCLKGKSVLTVDDGSSRKTYTLDNSGKGILIPAGLWGEQTYTPDTVLMVMADQPYDESDYIRDYNDFKKYRGDAA